MYNDHKYLAADHSLKAYDQRKVALPLAPRETEDSLFEKEIYARFIRHLPNVPNSRMEIKILAAIHFVADILDLSDALVAKTLVDMGLRAPRKAFPLAFLDFADKNVARKAWDAGPGPVASVVALREHWDLIGEERFGSHLRSHYATQPEGLYVVS